MAKPRKHNLKLQMHNLKPRLGVDSYDLRTLRALRNKLSRDYLGFFGSLSDLYGKSAQKKEIDSTVMKIKKTISLLNSVIGGTAIGEQGVDKLLIQIDDINRDKDYFLQKMPEVKAFSDKISKVVETTGISPGDLNVTKDIVKGVAKHTIKAQREGAASFLKRTMPGTIGMVGSAGAGIATALAGPFASILGPAAKDMFSLGRGISEKVQARRQAKLGEQLRPVGAGISPEVAGGIYGARTGGTALGGLGSKLSKEKSSEPLTYFFSKKAYKTKWTKELLQRITRLGRTGKGSLFGDLTSKLKGLLPAIGAVGLALGKAGLAGAITAFTVVELYRLAKVTKEYYNVLKNVKEFRKKQETVLGRQQEKVSGEVIFSKTEEGRQAAKKARKVYEEAQQERYKKESQGFGLENIETQWKRGASGIVSGVGTKLGLGGRTNFKPSGTIVPEVQTNVLSKSAGKGTYAGEDLETVMKANQTQNQRLEKSIDKLSRSIDKDKAPIPFKSGNVGNPYDSADILLMNHVSGDLALGGID